MEDGVLRPRGGDSLDFDCRAVGSGTCVGAASFSFVLIGGVGTLDSVVGYSRLVSDLKSRDVSIFALGGKVATSKFLPLETASVTSREAASGRWPSR